uniref:Uncharacterized protein n=1 Tax=Biomphalaria glabrata TaxID=6526 RepID=A0A2C9LGP2_BIOGL
MPSAQKGRYSEDNARSQHVPYQSDHFLPTLAAPVPAQEPSTVGHFRLVQSRNWASASSSNGLTATSHDAMDEGEHRVDRKKQLARRQLMGGLTVTHLPPQSELPRRTHSFIFRPDVGDSGHESNPIYPDAFRRQRHSLMHPRRLATQVFSSAVEVNLNEQNNRGSRRMIHSWNELVQELNRRKDMLQTDNLDHLALPLDNASNHSSGSSKKGLTRPYGGHTNGGNSQVNSVLTLTADIQTDGLGVTRYRPITPRFLAGLDKKRLPSRTLTQLWVNTIPDNLRSYRVTRPKTTLTYDDVTNFDK